MAATPPLPPRASAETCPVPGPTGSPPGGRPCSDASLPTPHRRAPGSLGWLSAADPRSSSTQSLVPSVSVSVSDSAPRRKLLLVYIHGFYGNDQSFRSFPAHVHSLLPALLVDSHVIHSKVYPRYKTYRAIDVARDRFSAWLEPHESPSTDVILIGHSMGGLLAADVVLMPNHNPQRQQAFKHRILGTISLDSPFLGLHPGIIVSGISSLFQPAPTRTAEDSLDETSTASSPPSSTEAPHSIDPRLESTTSSTPSSPPACRDTDPCFDPPYWNDEPFREQPWVKRIIHFTSKHKPEGMFSAVRNHIVSHLEFGGCLADYPGLVSRYKKLRALEDVDELRAVKDGHPSAAHARVRFVNYYTLSSGRPKPSKSPLSGAGEPSEAAFSDTSRRGLDTDSQSWVGECNDEDEALSTQISMLDITDGIQDGSQSSISTPRVSVEAPSSDRAQQRQGLPKNDQHHQSKDTALARASVLSMQAIEPVPMEPDKHTPQPEQPAQDTSDQLLLDLPPIPDEPPKPQLPDLEQYADRDARKQADKEAKRAQKAYDRAIKDRARAVRERDKLLEKRRKKARQEADRLAKDAHKRVARDEVAAGQAVAAEHVPRAGPDDATPGLDTARSTKMRKFCSLPGKANGARDETWVDVYMDGVDEVGAHCGLFAPGPHYDKLVGDVGSRIVSWVQDDMSKRAILSME